MVDTPLGFLKIPVCLIATECEREGKVVDTILPLTEGDGDIHLEIDWVPLDNNLVKVRRARCCYEDVVGSGSRKTGRH